MAMTFQESLLTAVFCMMIVFIILFLISIAITVFSFLLGKFSPKAATSSPAVKKPVAAQIPVAPDLPVFSSGTLKLKDVDEPTAAMIMAIVSDESGIPLSELCFKSIALIQQ
jgi:Na+-transporting methylmalonyl-CoA/oxaloacetate decarboxylase gamma subunit